MMVILMTLHQTAQFQKINVNVIFHDVMMPLKQFSYNQSVNIDAEDLSVSSFVSENKRVYSCLTLAVVAVFSKEQRDIHGKCRPHAELEQHK